MRLAGLETVAICKQYIQSNAQHILYRMTIWREEKIKECKCKIKTTSRESINVYVTRKERDMSGNAKNQPRR